MRPGDRANLIVIVASLVLCFTSPSFGQTKALVISTIAKIHNGPSTASDITREIRAGAEVKVETRGLRDDWALVSVDGEEGWVDRNDIRVMMDDPWESAAWIYMGRSVEMHGFTVRFYVNASQIVRRGDTIRFWTKMIPNDRSAYFDFLMKRKSKMPPEEFSHNTDLWEGNCSRDTVTLRRTIFYWRNGKTTRPNVTRKRVDADSGTAAEALLAEACKASKR